MPLTAFIVRPFAVKEFMLKPELAAKIEVPKVKIWEHHDGKREPAYEVSEVSGLLKKVSLNFDWVAGQLLTPVLSNLRITGYTTEAFPEAGNIREDMFRQLLTADLVIADVSIYNPNVYYELGIRHAFRDRHTFMICSEASDQPFDLRTDRYFLYDWKDPGKRETIERLTKALQATISSEKGDSPVFKLMPRLESEDRSRFLSVPAEFKEEVERALKHRRGGDLRLLALEAEDFLWEIEGLRLIGRAQFELNYHLGAKNTWEAILSRYPEDVEANTILSTIYQRLNDEARSEQALSRVSKQNSLSASRQAEVRGLLGRNLKARWVASWKNENEAEEAIQFLRKQARKDSANADQPKADAQKAEAQKKEPERNALRAARTAGLTMLKEELKGLLEKDPTALSKAEEKTKTMYLAEVKSRVLNDDNLEKLLSALPGEALHRLKKQAWAKRALRSPLLQRAYESYEQAFMADLNYPYAGLNALGLLLIQVDLAERYGQVWESLQVKAHDAERELMWRKERIARLRAAIDVSLEAERLRLRQEGRVDFWFETIEASYHCLTSDRPEMVAQAYADALIWSPPSAGTQMYNALQLYRDLEIHELKVMQTGQVTLRDNIRSAMAVLGPTVKDDPKEKVQHILLFAGLRVDDPPPSGGPPPAGSTGLSASPFRTRFPRDTETKKRARHAIQQAVLKEKSHAEGMNGEILCGLVGGTSGGDLLFHDVCAELKILLCLFLPLPKEQFVGKYVAPAGPEWVAEFNSVYRRQRQAGEKIEKLRLGSIRALNVMTESQELPRWLQGKSLYNVGRRGNLWMLQSAMIAASLTDAELTLIVLWDGDRESGLGGLGDLVGKAEKNGLRVIKLEGWNHSPSGGGGEPSVVETPAPATRPPENGHVVSLALAGQMQTEL